MKISNYTVIMLSMIFFFISQGISFPLGLSAGATVWYSWWKPAWENNNTARGQTTPLGDKSFVDKPDYKQDGAFLYGPTLSLTIIDNLRVSSVFVLGQYKSKFKGEYTAVEPDFSGVNLNYMKGSRYNQKYDSDTTVEYTVYKFMKVFAGFKFQGYDYRYYARWISSLLTTQVPWTASGNSQVKNYGPGAGIGFTVNLVENLFLLANISILILWGTEKTVLDLPVSGTGIVVYPRHKKGVYYSYGGNVSLSLAYYIDRISTTVGLGGRYQVLRYEQATSEMGFTDFDNQYDHFWGITFSVVYSIKLL